MRAVPETGNRGDWPRLVSQTLNRAITGIAGILGRLSALEASKVQGFEILAAAPDTPFEGQSYYDSTLKKVRTWDNAAWNDHW